MKIHDFQKYKASSRKINFITCYDYSSAKIIDNTNIDCVLIGDSVAMTMHGKKDTTYASIDMIELHTEAVAKGIKNKFIVSDLPFMSYRGSLDNLNSNVLKLIQAGANAVKLEGVDGNEKYIKHLINSGVPVMGHIGLTPQFINVLGGYKVQGKTKESSTLLLKQAKKLQKAGCFSIVLECVPTDLAKIITDSLDIPTIGIGAGNKTDGQILVLQDLLGMNLDFTPKFVKKYMYSNLEIHKAINNYCYEVQQGYFPCEKYSFDVGNQGVEKKLKIFKSAKEIKEYLSKLNKYTSVGFVPTMGNLHDGHGALIKESVNNNDITVLSIFVNPTQFNNKDDLKNYPKTLDDDLKLAKKLGADCVFVPSADDIYPENFEFRMTCNSEFAYKCEGGRKGHFDGMLTVVLKLLNIIKPTNAYFGEKDYQQLKLVQEFVLAFFLDTKIIPCEIVRLDSGLAMSSRNNRLSKGGIDLASKVSNIIRNEQDISQAIKNVQKLDADVEVIYIEDIGSQRLYAFIIEGIRLIDNYSLIK